MISNTSNTSNTPYTNMETYFSKFDNFSKTIEHYGHRADAEHDIEFECILKKPFISKYNFLRIFDMCKRKSCQDSYWKNIRNESITLDVSIEHCRLTIYGKFYINKFLKNEDAVFDFPNGTWSLIKKIREEESIDIDDGSFRLSLKRETVIKKNTNDYAFLMSSLTNRNITNQNKWYRLKKRESYQVENEFVIDLTVVKEGPNIKNLCEKYEVELEYTPNSNSRFNSLIFKKILYQLLKSHRDSMYLKPVSVLKAIYEKYKEDVSPFYKIKNNNSHTERFPDFGPKVVSLSMERLQNLHKDIQDNVVQYTITEKTDGLRMIGYVFENELYLHGSKSDYFHPTNITLKGGHNGCVFDGEYVDELKDRTMVHHYLIFDCYLYRNSEVVALEDIRMQNLIDRLKLLDGVVFNADPIFVVKKKVLKVISHGPQNSLYADSKTRLSEAGDGNYEIDGLIYTPNEAVGGAKLWENYDRGGPNNKAIVKTDITFNRLLKWKDTEFNSIDFKITFLKDHDDFLEIGDDRVLMRVKECTLSVGYNSKTSPIDYYEFLNRLKQLKHKNNHGCYTTSVFKSHDPINNESYLVRLPIYDDQIRCKEKNSWSGQIIRNGDIVECKYVKDAPGKFKWIPIRIRKDKDVPNAYTTAIDIWKSYFNPVTKKTIISGENIQINSDVYYAANSINNHIDINIRKFHRLVKDGIFSEILEKDGSGKKLLDIASGRGGDINRYYKFNINKVVGVDHSTSNLHKNPDGAYARLLEKAKNNKAFDFSKYIFLAGDGSKLFSKNDSFHNIYKNIVDDKILFQDACSFDAASIFFAIHYMFKDNTSFQNLLQNLDDNIKIGGYFGGCCFDGDIIDGLFSNKETTTLNFNNSARDKILRIEKLYDKKENFGSTIQVEQFSIGMQHNEYLVDFNVLIGGMKTIGFDCVHTKTFECINTEYNERGTAYTLNALERNMSFLNRAFVFKRIKKNDAT